MGKRYPRKSLQLAVLAVATALLLNCTLSGDWRTASRASAGLAPGPDIAREAILQVYGARAWGWRGWFGIHTWIAAKREGARAYTVYEVIGWRANHGLPVLRIAEDIPDRYWFGEKPTVLKDLRGNGVEALIDAVDAAARRYPWAQTYKVFPGPNSNTFTAWIARQVPGLHLELPFRAIGSGYADKSN